MTKHYRKLLPYQYKKNTPESPDSQDKNADTHADTQKQEQMPIFIHFSPINDSDTCNTTHITIRKMNIKKNNN